MTSVKSLQHFSPWRFDFAGFKLLKIETINTRQLKTKILTNKTHPWIVIGNTQYDRVPCIRTRLVSERESFVSLCEPWNAISIHYANFAMRLHTVVSFGNRIRFIKIAQPSFDVLYCSSVLSCVQCIVS